MTSPYRAMQPPSGQYPRYPAPAATYPNESRTPPWWALTTFGLCALNLGILLYLLVVVVRFQIALAEFQDAFRQFPSRPWGR